MSSPSNLLEMFVTSIQRLAKWFTTLSPKDKAKIVKDVSQLVLARRTRMCNFLEYKGADVPVHSPSPQSACSVLPSNFILVLALTLNSCLSRYQNSLSSLRLALLHCRLRLH